MAFRDNIISVVILSLLLAAMPWFVMTRIVSEFLEPGILILACLFCQQLWAVSVLWVIGCDLVERPLVRLTLRSLFALIALFAVTTAHFWLWRDINRFSFAWIAMLGVFTGWCLFGYLRAIEKELT